MTGWRPALRLAWRDAWRAKGRSILVLVMITLPVLAVTAASVVLATSDVSGAESVERRLGTADALVRAEEVARPVVQSPDPDQMGSWSEGRRLDQPVSPELIGATLGRDVRGIGYSESYVQVVKGDRALDVEVTEVDLRDPLADGLFRLTSGELPDGPDEVVVNDALARRGIGIGDALTLRSAEESPTVVGIGESARIRDFAFAAGPTGALGLDEVAGPRSWLIDADGPVTWGEVLAINKVGGTVVSEAVLIDPPDLSAIANRMGVSTGEDGMVAIIALVVTMALLEVVLLAGPAFAVGARRQSRSLALMAACGGTPAQSRRVVLASGVVLGGLAALMGIVMGVLVGIALVPVAQTQNGMWFGPLEVRWSYVAAIAGFGLLSALLAAVVPAWIASRQDVVAVLAGRRGDLPPTAKSPVFGLVLLLAGSAGAAYGATHPDGGEYWIAASAIVAVLGMVFVVPLVVSLVSRLAGRMPLTMRYAARDAARHRTRTVPAVAAVAATVAGVVALGIANTSDEAENAATYAPRLAMGEAGVTWYPEFNDLSAASPDWDQLESVAADNLPAATVTRIVGLQESLPSGDSVTLGFSDGGRRPLVSGWSSGLGSSILVSDEALPGVLTDVSGVDRERADAALRAGRPVVFTDHAPTGAPIRMRGDIWHRETQEEQRIKAREVDAEVVQIDGEFTPVVAVVPSGLLESVGQTPTTVGLMVTDAEITEDQEQAAKEAIAGAVPGADFYVERGYQPDDEVLILLLVLFTLGGVLMLGGTLTATFLALSDARPDLATLSAVGAAPRSRRGVAAAYALVVGFIGALLGAAVGFIPGIAITRPLTSNSSHFADENGVIGTPGTGPFLDIPWLMILGLVVALPLLTALVVGLTARSRLPLATRLT